MKRSRQAAAAAGEPKYKTGKPCKNGHIGERYTKTGACVQCAIEKAMAHNKRIQATLKFNQTNQE